jgi:hypothetical protein
MPVKRSDSFLIIYSRSSPTLLLGSPSSVTWSLQSLSLLWHRGSTGLDWHGSMWPLAWSPHSSCSGTLYSSILESHSEFVVQGNIAISVRTESEQHERLIKNHSDSLAHNCSLLIARTLNN